MLKSAWNGSCDGVFVHIVTSIPVNRHLEREKIRTGSVFIFLEIDSWRSDSQYSPAPRFEKYFMQRIEVIWLLWGHNTHDEKTCMEKLFIINYDVSWKNKNCLFWFRGYIKVLMFCWHYVWYQCVCIHDSNVNIV